MYTLSGVAVGAGIALAPAIIIAKPKAKAHVDDLFTYDSTQESLRYQKKAVQFAQKLRQIISPAKDSVRDLVGAAAGFILSSDNQKEALELINKGCSASMAARTVLLGNLEAFFHDNSDIKTDRNELTGLIVEFISTLEHPSDSKLELPNLNHDVIVLAKDLSPAIFLSLKTEFIKGVVLEGGRDSGHLGIVLRELGIPAIYGVFGATSIEDNTKILVDGNNGVVIVEPPEDFAKEKLINQDFYQDVINDESLVNITIAPAIGAISSNNLENSQVNKSGLGLLRSEFLFLSSTTEPSEDDMYQKFFSLFKKIRKDAPITARTFDFADDKKPLFSVKTDDNGPLKGYGACVGTTLLKNEIRALLRASEDRVITIVFPLITKISEKNYLVNLAKDCIKELDKENIKHGDMKISFMIETPAAVLLAQEFAKDCSLMLIGTSSLAEYASAPCPPENAFTPVLAKMIVMAAKAASTEHIPLGMAGRFAARPELLPFFYKLGVSYIVTGTYNINKLRLAVEKLNLEKDITPKFDDNIYSKVINTYTGSDLNDLIIDLN